MRTPLLPKSETWLQVAAVAQLAGVTPETIRNWERRGWLKATKTSSGTRLFRRQDVVDYLQTYTKKGSG